MPDAYERGPDGRIVMLCLVCKGRCHPDGPRERAVEVGNRGGQPIFKTMICRRCCCHDCVQLADDPARQALAPHYLKQTAAAPLNIESALKDLVGGIGFSEPAPRRIGGPSGCMTCKRRATSRCIDCDEALCSACLGKHRCRRGR